MPVFKDRFLAIVNPAAGGGKCGKLAGPALARLRDRGLQIDVIASTGPSHAVQLAREAFDQRYRKFLAVGGDGTAHEILNGIFTERDPELLVDSDRVALGFLPFGTGNSFLRDFTRDGAEASMLALIENRKRPVDLVRLRHATGEVFSINILSLGFPADVGVVTNRYFKPLGPLGYLLGVFIRTVPLRRRAFVLRSDDETEWDERRSLFLAFNNTKFTGGKMMIAPDADPSDGLIEFVRWGPIGRLGLIRMLPRLFTGTHIQHPLAARKPVKHVEFRDADPVDVLVDGEILSLECRFVDVVPSALDVYI
jgi:diacylglycerol kinase family enzyme